MSELEHRIARLEAIEAIRKLTALYAKAGDANNNHVQMRPLFSEDAVLDVKGFGRWEGLEDIIDGLAAAGRDRILWGLHYPVSPIVDLADDLQSAHAFWWLWEVTQMRAEDGSNTESLFLGAVYKTDFVQVDGVWKIKHMNLEVKATVPFAGGELFEAG